MRALGAVLAIVIVTQLASCAAQAPGDARRVRAVAPGDSAQAAVTSAAPGDSAQARAVTPPRPRQAPIVLSNLHGTDGLPEACARLGVTPCLIMYQNWIDPDDTGTWARPDLTAEWIRANVPEGYDGYLVLDWEAGVVERIAAGPGTPRFDGVVRELVKLLEFAKGERPLAKVGYYDLPYSSYWRQDDAWRERMRALAPVFDASDALFPSAYDFYPGEAARDSTRFRAMVELALELSGGKPVFPYTHHRYHHDETDSGYRLIPRDEYVRHVRSLMQAEWNGRRPAGVVAWAEDAYFHDRAFGTAGDGTWAWKGETADRVRAVCRQETPEGTFAADHAAAVYARVCCLLGEAVLGVPCPTAQ